jgi:hypothetical protein
MQLTDEQIERLRKSGIRLDAEGRFWHEGAEVAHHGLRAALWRWLDRNPDGRWVLRLDEKRFVYLDVDDAPYVVRSARWEGDLAIGRLSDDSEIPLDLSSLHERNGQRYVNARFEARLSTAAWNVLAERMEERNGRVFIGPHEIGKP